MLKFIKGKGHQPSAERLKLQKELFNFKKTIAHGFTHRPSSLAWDPELQLMAIGTRTGQIRVYGAPGVEFFGQHNEEGTVLRLFFLPNQARLISLCEGSSLHLWEINEKNGTYQLEEVKSCSLEARLKTISACCLQKSGEHLLIGTEVGNIYLLDVKSFEMTEKIIYQDVVMQNVPDDYKVNPGAVEVIAEHPTNLDKILIGYNRGLIVLWDNQKLIAEKNYISNQQLESLAWHRGGTRFVSAHNDGSYMTWSLSDTSKPLDGPNSTYGPFPCKGINKIIWNSVKGGDDFIIFSGGMPRASYGDKHTLTVLSGEKHQVLDFTSKVVDIFTISESNEDAEYDNPHSLVVLAEEELIAIDLESEGWLPFHLPYLSSLHSSAITCAQHCGNITAETWDKIVAAGQTQSGTKYSQREWPVNGGTDLVKQDKTHDLLLTGHEDGTVRFWDASGVAIPHLYTLHTASYFVSEDIDQGAEEEEWPPFRKVGTFDPYSDDPRLAIKKILLCALSGTLVVAGTAGQVLVLDVKPDPIEKEIEVANLNIVGDRDNFVWKGHDQLNVKQGAQKMDAGYQPSVLIQLAPPAAITALSFHSEWQLVAAGTAHGFGLFDYLQKKAIMAKCTLNRNDMTATGDIAMSRRKSFKKSLRESFRRLRKGRSQRGKREKTPTRSPSEEQKGSKEASPTAEGDAPAVTTPDGPSPATSPHVESKPVERQIEARSVDDALGSMVRCLYLAQSFIINNAISSATLWAGTNSGAIFVFTIFIPGNEKRATDTVSCQLGKEIQLKHRAPVIAIQVMDHSGYPLPEPLEVKYQKVKTPDMSGNHRVLICSEEQFKVFTLPSLKPYCKFKLTAHEGSRVRKIGVLKFRSKSDENYSEHCMVCLTNQGDLSIFSIPDLRKQLVVSCIKKEDINGISSLVFTRNGQGFYLHSPCEFLRFTLSAQNCVEASPKLELPEGTRPNAIVPAEETNAVEAEAIAAEEIVEQKEAGENPKPESKPVVEENCEKEEGRDAKTTNVEVNGETDPPEELENMPKSGSKDADTSQDDEKRDLDITVDSVKDHLASLNADDAVVTVEKQEQSKVVKTHETTVTVTSTTLTSETIVNSTSETEKGVLSASHNDVAVSYEHPKSQVFEIKNAPIASIEELTYSEEDLKVMEIM